MKAIKTVSYQKNTLLGKGRLGLVGASQAFFWYDKDLSLFLRNTAHYVQLYLQKHIVW